MAMTGTSHEPERAMPYGGPHDPGPAEAARRARALEDAAARPIATPSGGEIRIGTASWTDPTMTARGVFYPPDAETAEARLAYYARVFPLVEVDATYYALPLPATAQLWARRTPPGFTFDVKAHALMTGQPSETRRLPRQIREALPPTLAARSHLYGEDLPRDLRDEIWRLFLAGIEPLRASGKLGAVLLQYPRWVEPSARRRDAILEARERLAGLTCAVEFRNAAWLDERNAEQTLQFLADHGLPFVIVDEPQGLRSSVPPVVATTSPQLAIVRFHGRRAETWEARGIPAVERYRYLYDRAELGEWVPRIIEAATATRQTHVLLNNCFANYGATNAREIAALLQGIRLD
jgi:uncharacterized protein YecE (DUF72 family)